MKYVNTFVKSVKLTDDLEQVKEAIRKSQKALNSEATNKVAIEIKGIAPELITDLKSWCKTKGAKLVALKKEGKTTKEWYFVTLQAEVCFVEGCGRLSVARGVIDNACLCSKHAKEEEKWLERYEHEVNEYLDGVEK